MMSKQGVTMSWLTSEEAAHNLPKGTSMPGEWTRKGNSLARKMGRAWRFRASELEHRKLSDQQHSSRTPTGAHTHQIQHVDESLIQKAVWAAVLIAGLPKGITCHTFRHSFAAHALKAYCADRKPMSASYADQSM